MAMSYHMEARIKQDRLNRWAEQQRRTELEPQNQAVGDRLEDVGYKTKMDKVLTTDAEQFHQTRSVHTWAGAERNRRCYDYSCEGPLLGSSWRGMRRELNFQESCLPAAIFESRGRVVPRHEFVPADAAFRGK
ncbi:uncharacterized protein [Littorina saxatilis]|uniref:Uncharacterized protein n=1 Tax=Littorina saxatilis TaxID=31220 RepID=A0AAN9GKW8_9CAEN